MDFGALDVLGVGDAVADVFGEGSAPLRRICCEGGGGGGGGGNDADFCGGEFAQIAD